MADEPRHRVAVVGAGIGREHVAALKTLPEHYQVTVICDNDEPRAAGLAETVTNCRIEPDLDRLLADGDVDILINCLPPHLHADVSIRAVETGKHVVCEKPIALSLADVARMQEAAETANRIIAPVFQYRFGHGLRQLQHLIDKGLAGRPLVASIETHWNRDSDYYARPWRGTFDGEGGGVILSHAIHNHDLLTLVFGPLKRVSAHLGVLANPIEVEDSAAIALEFENGALATSSITLGGAQNWSGLRFCFSGVTAENSGEAYKPGQAPWTFIARAPNTQEVIDEAVASVAFGPESFAGFYTELDHHLRGKPSSYVAFEDGKRSIELVTALYRANRTGCAVELPLAFEDDDWGGWPRR